MSMTSSIITAPDERRRSSAASWVKIPRLALRGAKRGGRSDSIDVTTEDPPTPCKLLELPSELVTAIFDSLELGDVFALRSTNKAFNALVTATGSDVSRYWVKYKLNEIPRLLGQQPQGGEHWRFVLQQTRRWRQSDELADLIKEYIQYKTLLYHNAQRNIRFAPTAKRIRERMTPLLFVISAYLADIKSLVLDLASRDDSSIDYQEEVNAHTEAMLSGMPPDDLKSLHYMWLFLLWLLNTLISRPTYAGTIERTVRGWTSDPLDRTSLTRILIFGNLSTLRKLIQLRDYNSRRKWAQTFLKTLDPDETIKWAEHWQDLDVGVEPAPPAERAARAMKLDMHMQCLWTEGALRAFESAGEENALMDDERGPSANNTVRLLADLAGYDLFHSSVPQDHAAAIPSRALALRMV